MAGFLAEPILLATIREWASTGCDAHPCALAVGRYMAKVSGLPLPAIPDHPDRKAVATLLRERGGLVRYAGEIAASLSWRVAAAPGRGDVGVIDVPAMGLTCAICLGRSWVAKGHYNVLTVSAPHVAAWSYEGCRQHSRG